MRKILLGLGLTLGVSTLLTAGPIITFNFEDGRQSTFSVPGDQRISVSDLKQSLWKVGHVPEGVEVELMDESKNPVSPTQVFKGRIAVKLWVKLVKLAKEFTPKSPNSPMNKRHK